MSAVRPLLLAVVLVAALLPAARATAAPAAPHWSILSQSQPSVFRAGDARDAYRFIVRNDGALQTHEEVSGVDRTTVTDALPEGVTAQEVSARAEGPNGSGSPRYQLSCSTVPVLCSYEEGTERGPLPPGATIVMTVVVSIAAGVPGPALDNSASVSGGGAPAASVTESTPVGSAPIPFGLSYLTAEAAQESGEAEAQAGSHPFELTTSFGYTIDSREVPSERNGQSESPLSTTSVRDLEVELPPGLVGDPGAVPRCSQQEFQSQEKLDCPVDTQVGTLTAYFYGTFHPAVYPVYNVAPPPGQPVELGFTIAGIGHVPLFLHLRDDDGPAHDEYGLAAQLTDLPEAGPLQGAILSLWGVPADGTHDLEREGTTGQGSQQAHEFCKPSVEFKAQEVQTLCPSGIAAKPFLTLPSACQSQPLGVGLFTDSWQGESEQFPASGQTQPTLGPLTGCERLSFSPLLTVQPETAQAGAPSGYTVALHIPQNEEPTGLATPDLKDAVITLPPDTFVSPSAGNGLQGCGEEQFEVDRLAAAACPTASTIGSVQIATPLLTEPLKGPVFLAKPACEPCSAVDAREGRLIRLFIQAQGSGVTIKLIGSVAVDQSSGQLTATFANAPQLPLEDLQLTLDGGPGAPLANGSQCGVALAASSSLTAYSSEGHVEQPSEPFELTGCPTAQFAPAFVAGTTNNQAGAFSPTIVSVARGDQDETLQRLAVRLPPGLWGMVSSVPRCTEAQAQAASCPSQSSIGGAAVSVGAGRTPLTLNGSVYLTGPYEGAPFGLSIEVPAVVGPLNLGVMDVRAAIAVDPTTGALIVTSDPLPQSDDGVPLQIRTVSLDLNREGFMFNPTNCARQAVQGMVTSAAGATAAASIPFQAANCATLPFAPKLSALTHARPTKAGGAYLHVKVLASSGQANIAKLKVDLPKQLAARGQTLRKACAAGVFEADPAACPAASVVGTMTVVTPVLGHVLSGPAYFVSHGGAAFPDLEIVLQGEGVMLRLDGQTSVKAGITSTTFKALPDAPISTLDLVLDSGPHSALAADLPASAKGSMCAQKLAMPIAVTGQNGAVIKATATIAVSGCPRHGSRRRLDTRANTRAPRERGREHELGLLDGP